eukprot:NODE_18_length_47517_cov_0.674814.p12 type:complete len:394 gc:universal NODE_18_length_47517_cov_0.674814:39680-38499(-)
MFPIKMRLVLVSNASSSFSKMEINGRSNFQSLILGDQLYIIGGTQPNIIKLNINNPFSLNNIPYVFYRQLNIPSVFSCCVPSNTDEVLCINHQSYFIQSGNIQNGNGYDSDSFNCQLYQDALYVYGGELNGNALNNLYLLTPRDMQWKQIQSGLPALFDYTWNTILTNSFIIGGYGSDGLHDIKKVYKIDMNTLQIQEITTNQGPDNRQGHGSCAMGEYIYVYGGKSGNTTLSDLWAFNTIANNWTKIDLNLPKRQYLQMQCIRRHIFFIFGNDGNADQYTLYLYSPDRNLTSLVQDYQPIGSNLFVNPPNFGRNAPVNAGLSIGAILGITLASLFVFVSMILCIWIRKRRDKNVFYDDMDESEEPHTPAQYTPPTQFKVLNPDLQSSTYSFK